MKKIKMHYLKSILILSCFFIAKPCCAQDEATPLPDKPGHWQYESIKNQEEKDFKMSSAETIIFYNKLKSIAEQFRQNPLLFHPIGIELYIRQGDQNLKSSQDDPQKRIDGHFAIKFCEWYKKGGKEFIFCDETPSMTIATNNPGSSYRRMEGNYKGDGYDENLSKAAHYLNEIFAMPFVLKDYGNGVVFYANKVIVIANSKRPYWVPVTVREYLDRLLAFYRLEAKSPHDSTGISYLINVLGEERKALAEHLSEPAYYSDALIVSKVGIKENETSIPLMKFNPAYFDVSLPRTSVQLITIFSMSSGDTNDPDEMKNYGMADKAIWNFMHSLDAKAFSELLDIK